MDALKRAKRTRVYPEKASGAKAERPEPIKLLDSARHWTHPTRDAEHVLRRDAIRITEFAAHPELGVLALDRD